MSQTNQYISSGSYTYPAQRYYHSGGTEAVTYHSENWQWAYQTRSNDPESRAKPADLLKSITPQARQFYIKRKNGSTGEYVYDDTETPTRSQIWKREDRCIDKFSYVHTESPQLPDWATALRLQIKDEAINLGTTLAEYRQSVRMFGSAAQGVVNAWRLFRGKQKRRKNLTMCSVAASELVYTYGVEPLVSDLYDSVERLRYRLEYPVFRRFHTRAKDTVYVKYEDEDGWTTGGFNGWSWHKMSQDITAYVWFDLEKASNFIFGNPLEIGWELVPYSFVVDWMIPIGDALIALDALKAVDTMRVSVTTKEEKKFRLYHFGMTSPNHSLGEIRARGPGARPSVFHLKSHEREVDSTLPLPSIPKFSLSGSIRRLLNASALLVNARGCKGRTPRYRTSDFS